MYFRNYGLQNTWLDICLKKSRFAGPFQWQHGKRAQTQLQSEREHRSYIYGSF